MFFKEGVTQMDVYIDDKDRLIYVPVREGQENPTGRTKEIDKSTLLGFLFTIEILHDLYTAEKFQGSYKSFKDLLSDFFNAINESNHLDVISEMLNTDALDKFLELY